MLILILISHQYKSTYVNLKSDKKPKISLVLNSATLQTSERKQLLQLSEVTCNADVTQSVLSGTYVYLVLKTSISFHQLLTQYSFCTIKRVSMLQINSDCLLDGQHGNTSFIWSCGTPFCNFHSQILNRFLFISRYRQQ